MGSLRFAVEAATFVMQKKLARGTITVPVPDHVQLRSGTLRSIIRQSGVARSEFEA
jgi:hypothetical protein